MLDKTSAASVNFDFSDDPEFAWTLPGHTYWSEEWFERERNTIFCASWRCIGHQSEIPNPGDYLTNTIVDQPILVIRTSSGHIKAFHNVCKHRAHLLLPNGKGSIGKSLIRCPYHAWSYDVDGALRAAPHCELIKGFDKSEIKLDSLKAEIIKGFIFVNLDENAPDLEPRLSPALERYARHFNDLDNYQLASVTNFDIAGNWKNVGDNLLECYHCYPAHKAFVDLVDMDTYRVETADVWSWQGGVTRPHNSAYTLPEGLSDSEREFVTFYIWPDMAFTRFPGSDVMATFVFEAVTPELTHQRFNIYSPDGELDEVGRDIDRYFREVLGPEDVGLVENVQKGLHSRSYDRGRFMIDEQRSYFSEHAVHHFHSLVMKYVS